MWVARSTWASSTPRPPSPSRRILGRISRMSPWSTSPPAILLPGGLSHLLVLFVGLSVPQPSGQVLLTMHTSSSVSNTHNVSTFTTAGLRNSAEPPLVAIQCYAHSTTWQPGCVVCDVALVHAAKAPVIDPKLAVPDRLLGRITKPPTHAVKLGVVGLEIA